MPLYEYECDKCGRFEKIQKFSDKPLRKCPTCKGSVERLISAPAIQFKGSGWYVTDYAKKSGAPAKSEKSKDSKSDSSKSDSGSSPKDKSSDKAASGGSSAK